MTAIEQILEYKKTNQPFSLHLSDGRRFLIEHGDFVSTHPDGKGTNVIVYGHGEAEEHYIPSFAISSVSKNATT
jgi:hypothetical protein